MNKINIPSNISDINYRYKRERINITILNNCGGVTQINNLDNIAESLGENKNNIISYLKKNLNVSIDKKNIIKKIETVDNLEILLENYISEFILCKNCNNPEFIENLTNKKNGQNNRMCKACGKSRFV